mmetsp:Transcript_5362/g.13622  ORF Transcript_5362/g.13622 Transcript_5362/m.13622 type:complete len:402 (+) Transcript_5362:304-1509(+)
MDSGGKKDKDVKKKKLKKVRDFVLGDVLGEGAYGQVREGLRVKEGDPKFGQRVAVKIISKRLLRKARNGQQNLKREVNCLKKLKHQNIIQLYDVIDGEEFEKVYLVFELANYGSVQDLLEMMQIHMKAKGVEVVGSGLKEQHIQNLFYQLVQGLMACHAKGVVHRDIKPSNLQITSDGILKIIDFGVAETLDHFNEIDDTEKFAGTPAFQPPEVAGGCRTFSATKVDIWAAGVTLYVMGTNKTPFLGDKIDELYSNISQGEYEMPEHFGDNLKDLVSGLMKPNPEERISLEAVSEHPWLQGDEVKQRPKLQTLPARDKSKTLLTRYMEENSSDEEPSDSAESAHDEEDDNEVERQRLENLELLSGKRITGTRKFNQKYKEARFQRMQSDVDNPKNEQCAIS